MAQMTESLARAILNGGGCTRHELEQLCRHFLATPAGSAEGVANLAVKVAGEAQRWHERAIAAESEAARLREALRLVDANTTRADWPEDIFTAIRSAAMGSANGQGDAADTTAGDAEPEARG